MDRCRRDKSYVKDLESVLVKAKVPPENAAFIVGVMKRHHGSYCRYMFKDVLKVLLIHLTGNTDAVSGEQLIAELPYRGTRPLVDELAKLPGSGSLAKSGTKSLTHRVHVTHQVWRAAPH